ncbi:MAG: hypothetical protein FJ147_05780 [Deltaproteobacteria bacterium]|nr:hypothetical protein [Deltaproteobacteria bacterium]
MKIRLTRWYADRGVLGIFVCLVVGSMLPERALSDSVIPDDLIVQGAQCVGTPCVNDEEFDGATIKLKSETPIIKFEDTSVSAGFPTTDWQLTANDTVNGGANRFSIEDVTSARVPFTILGGAASHALFVNATGQVGFGTSTPGLLLHLSTSNTPAVRLEQNDSGGFTAQTWDIGADHQQFFIQDATNSNSRPFRIGVTAPTNSIDIAADGRVGFGVVSGQGSIHIGGAATDDIFNGIGPNLAAGPAFNFGYSGGSFGRGSGFFNVRPDAAEISPNPSLRFATANVQRMIIDREQRVGIGLVGTNPIPTQRLDVNGNIRASGSFIAGSTTLTVPDYVFASDYKLRPLKDVATFVAQNRHLPEIPPAHEIQARGVDLSEMQMLLLKKIEELTLYTLQQAETDIQQGKTTDTHQQTLDAIATRLTALERQQKRVHVGQRKNR